MTPFEIGSGIVQGGTSLLNASGNFITNLLNYNLQKKQLAYQQDLQKQIFSREDNAVQRRVEDLKKAGLSPTLAAGDGAGAGSVVSTNAPQAQYSDVNFGGVLDAVKAAQSVTLAEQEKAKNNSELQFLSSQINNLNAQTTKLNIDNGFESQMKSALLNQILADTSLKEGQKNKIEFDLEKAQRLVENEIKLSNQQVLRGNMMNWNLGFNNYFLQNYGYEPSKMTSMTGQLFNQLNSIFNERGSQQLKKGADIYLRPAYKSYW